MQEETIEYSNKRIKQTFCKKENIYQVLDSIKEKRQAEIDRSIEQSMSTGKATLMFTKNYQQAIFVKLNTIFRLQYVLNETEAFNFYSREENFALKQINLFYEIIDYINSDIGIVYIPDRITLAAFFRVNIETWDKLVNDMGDLPDRIRDTLKGLDEYIISLATNGVESDSIKNSALKRLEMKTKYGGHGVEYANPLGTDNIIIDDKRQSIRGKLGSGGKYNFSSITAPKVNESERIEEITLEEDQPKEKQVETKEEK